MPDTDRTYLTAIDLTDPPPPLRANRPRSWTDATSVHQAVMSLFPSTLPGAPTQRRSTSRILHRLEHHDHRPRLLIQSAVPPTAGTTKDITNYLAALTTGTNLILRCQLNTVTTEPRTGRRRAVPADQITDWAHTKLAAAGVTGTILAAQVMPLTFTRNGRTVPLRTAIIDAHTTITDPAAFATALTHGIGRARPYGCGLITTAPT